MNLSELLRLAWQSVRQNRLRSILTMLGIIIGVASVINMIAVSAGTEAAIEEQITGLGSNLIYVNSTPGRGGPGLQTSFSGNQRTSFVMSGGLTYDDASAIADEVEGVVAVVVEQQTSETVQAGDASLTEVAVLGTTSGFPSVRDTEVAEGRYFNDKEVDRKAKVAVLGASVAEDLFGDADPIGQTIDVDGTRLTVIGVFEARGTVSGVDFDARVYTPISVLFQRFAVTEFARIIGDRVRTIYVKVESPESLDVVIEQVELLLAKRHDVTLDSADFSVTTQQDIIETQESTTAAFRSLLGWVAGISLIVGGIGIMNIMLVSVTERTREIGIRQAVGATPNDIRWQFLTEALLLSLLGGLLGVFIGMGGSVLFGELTDMRTVIVPASVLLAFVAAAGVGIFFGYYPAKQASQLDPIEALRHE
jgi:putative ABC transport system permease protein